MTGARLLVTCLAAAALAALVACGAQSKPGTQSSPPPLRPTATILEQIAALDRQITADREAQGSPAPDPAAIEAAGTMSVLDAVGICARPLGDTCGDACTLSDSICGNAAKICDLAQQLPGDAWAAERCDAGKASCAASTKRCCACDA